MNKYELKPAQAVMVFDIPFPSDPVSVLALSAVLNDFLTPEGIGKISSVAACLDKHPNTEMSIIEQIRRSITGHITWDTKARNGIKGCGIMEEPGLIVRLIVFNPDGDVLSEQMRLLAREVVLHLICGRLAEELSTQEEVWVIESPGCLLHRWVRQEETGSGSSAVRKSPASVTPGRARDVFDWETGREFCQ